MAAPLLPFAGYLLRGAAVTAEVTALAGAVAIVLAVPVALARSSARRAVRWPATVYVEVLRGSSALVQLFVLFYILPTAGVILAPLPTAVLGLGLNISAYASEIIRAGLAGVDPGQREAAAALDLPRGIVFRRVVWPQAVLAMLPPGGNLLIELLKATSLVSLVMLTDLTFAGQSVVTTTGRATPVWLIVLVGYYAMSLPLGWGTRALERRLGRWRI